MLNVLIEQILKSNEFDLAFLSSLDLNKAKFSWLLQNVPAWVHDEFITYFDSVNEARRTPFSRVNPGG